MILVSIIRRFRPLHPNPWRCRLGGARPRWKGRQACLSSPCSRTSRASAGAACPPWSRRRCHRPPRGGSMPRSPHPPHWEAPAPAACRPPCKSPGWCGLGSGCLSPSRPRCSAAASCAACRRRAAGAQRSGRSGSRSGSAPPGWAAHAKSAQKSAPPSSRSGARRRGPSRAPGGCCRSPCLGAGGTRCRSPGTFRRGKSAPPSHCKARRA
mmetsp:Transcript_752/g.2004  ORF Transcript_752/g.2004 Transcript_752/m.2004 type:complete len:210 (-) Transcript_752:1054-1683(-)